METTKVAASTWGLRPLGHLGDLRGMRHQHQRLLRAAGPRDAEHGGDHARIEFLVGENQHAVVRADREHPAEHVVGRERVLDARRLERRARGQGAAEKLPVGTVHRFPPQVYLDI
ncbi:MAG: hypothetical protein M5U09_02115 [Gammaproteobacteria bacterium]|nr:hypothetical protein [Gammaproteobacteria bacterium]